jgi:hypothetical protein
MRRRARRHCHLRAFIILPSPLPRRCAGRAGLRGGMAEWLKAHAWKACIRETVSWVRIPLPPPNALRLLNKLGLCVSTVDRTPNGASHSRKSGRGRAWNPPKMSPATCGAQSWEETVPSGDGQPRTTERRPDGCANITSNYLIRPAEYSFSRAQPLPKEPVIAGNLPASTML